MRLGTSLWRSYEDPSDWAQDMKRHGFRASVCPIGKDADDTVVAAYLDEAGRNDLLIGEVGAWCNPISPDDAVRKAALEHCKGQLALAERLGALCCVNIAGSRGEQWDGPHPDNFSDATFALIVDSVREVIDAVKPRSTFYTLETMPWVFPDSADSYLKLIRAIDRPAFAVHLDPVNMVSSPRVFYRNGDMIRDFFAKLGPYIKNCHAKDIALAGRLTVHLDEKIPGQGALDYRTFLTELHKLDPDIPLIIEHLSKEEEYAEAAGYIRRTAESLSIPL
ncbi:sugar phosphate isomerase/epimerase family protein [Cohnella fermenti]|uniref:Sugar phosphate isomerase/epimerase n=1 Tax=Cohnella fermenti TaxID=2565925 RepID=A0A4S4C6I9_9BACL|nr:TIM barrel protein [Cohnella fermenti]THF83443.1 sugar phosphate isomerase/epimerase [Cohnella fermenti]